MNEVVFAFAIAVVAAIAGGAVGASLAGASAWKGAILIVVAFVLSQAVAEIFRIDDAVLSYLLLLAALGIVGGRWGMGLTGRQLGLVAIGGFLFAIVGVVALTLGLAVASGG